MCGWKSALPNKTVEGGKVVGIVRSVVVVLFLSVGVIELEKGLDSNGVSHTIVIVLPGM